MKLSEIRSNNQTIKLVNDSEFNSLGMTTSSFIEKGVLSFLNDEKYIDSALLNDQITSIITNNEIADRILCKKSIGIIICENPKALFYEVHNNLVDEQFYWSSFDNEIDESAIIGTRAIIANKNVKIGKNSIIEDGVIIHEGVIIGNNSVIRSGTILGTNGFQFYNFGNEVIQVKTGGLVQIQDNVEIQHNCCVDRGVFGGSTIIKKFVKIDNFVHIGHDCVIGERSFITAGSKFGGRTIIGSDCWVGVNSTISNGLNIGNGARISLGSVVTRDVSDNTTVTGNFAIDHQKFINFIKFIR